MTTKPYTVKPYMCDNIKSLFFFTVAKSMVEATINQKQVYFLQAANPKSR